MEQLLSEMSIGVIYAAKIGKGNTYREKVANFMSKYTDTPVNYYGKYELDRIMVNAFAELLNCAEHPGAIFYEYFAWIHQSATNYDDFDAMCTALSNVQVKEKDKITGEYKYINGFWAFNIDNYN